MKVKILVPVIALAMLVGGVAVYSISTAKAATATRENIAEQLAQKLGVDESKVDSAMTQIREERQATRKAEVSTSLDKAVTDGVITAEQKQKFLDRCESMENDRQNRRAEQEKWAEDNGIDMSKLKDYGIGGMGMGGVKGGRGMGFGGN